jgi:Mg2+ and Co2+ transporter CorA
MPEHFWCDELQKTMPPDTPQNLVLASIEHAQNQAAEILDDMEREIDDDYYQRILNLANNLDNIYLCSKELLNG